MTTRSSVGWGRSRPESDNVIAGFAGAGGDRRGTWSASHHGERHRVRSTAGGAVVTW
ncbi:MAG: hypothetical protein U5R48_14830 [Gammaproteobacteria bacterium]|nr:hypothetical protein [Gammaproteobacteria bacterium]